MSLQARKSPKVMILTQYVDIMLKYLVIQLDDTATSFCHYDITETKQKLISLDDLRNGVLFAMKENLNIQFVYPDYALPAEYGEIIESIDHVKIISSLCEDETLKKNSDVIVFSDWSGIDSYKWDKDIVYVLRTLKADLFDRYLFLKSILEKAGRINVIITDIDTFSEKDFDKYKQILSVLSDKIAESYLDGLSPQLNLLTDRMMLKAMNNCNAGDETITLAPDGKFYVCPAFYYEHSYSIGDLTTGVDIKNPQLYKLAYAPICRHCDAFHCKRCVWMNRKTTLEVNTPSHEQCVVAHLERNESCRLLDNIRKAGEFMPEITIPEIDYSDPFEKHNEW